jgi:transposase-like protein
MNCPTCQSENIIKNGSIHNGKQKYACKDCNRQFVLEPENCISPEKKDLIDKLLLEKITKAGIARAVEVSSLWLQDYVNEKYDAVKKRN